MKMRKLVRVPYRSLNISAAGGGLAVTSRKPPMDKLIELQSNGILSLHLEPR